MYPLSEPEYARLFKLMWSMPAIASTIGRRQNMEQQYYDHHRSLGIRLRGKYRRV